MLKKSTYFTMKNFTNEFLTMANKDTGNLDEEYTLLKLERDGSYSKVIVDEQHSAEMNNFNV